MILYFMKGVEGWGFGRMIRGDWTRLNAAGKPGRLIWDL